MRNPLFTLLFAGVVVGWACGAAEAQNTSSRTRAFDDYYRRPTVSPYLNLTNSNGFSNGQPNYQTLVRPIVESRRAIQRERTEIVKLQRQAAQQAIVQREGNQRLRPTGSSARYMYYSSYYQSLGQRR
jgi:hypothetical protein